MGLGFRYRPVGGGARFLLILAAVIAALSGTALTAQVVSPAADGGVPTLHVYTNLVQVPTLVLTMNQDLIDKPIAENRFSVSIDSGRWFRATHVRREGDDPVSLSILLDVSGDAAGLMPKMEDALGKLVPSSLHWRDRVSVYALDCTLRRSLDDAPANNVLLRTAVGAALEPWKQHKRNKPGKGCELKGHLWDGLGAVAVALSERPGRRVILVVTDGRDTGSRNSWDAVRYFAQTKGIAIFALNFTPASLGIESIGRGRGGYLPSGGRSSPVEKSLTSVCELSGGVVMRMSERTDLSKSLERFVTMLRERYIVEFPRPGNSTAGEHGLEVKIDKGVYIIIRPSGVSMPLPDPALATDPTTIQVGPSQTPEEGRRKVVTKPQ
jgi:hypothetical protein